MKIPSPPPRTDVSADKNTIAQLPKMHPEFPGVPGLVREVYGPSHLRKGDTVFNPTSLGGCELVAGFPPGRFSQSLASETARSLSPMGTALSLEGFDAIDPKTKFPIPSNGFGVYFKLSSRAQEAIDALKSNAKNNFVDFTRRASDAGGVIGEVMRNAWERGPEVVAVVAAILFKAVFGVDPPSLTKSNNPSSNDLPS
jgi:hypothetical protein